MEAVCLGQFPRMETGVSAGSGTWARSTLVSGGSFCGRLGPRKRPSTKLDDRPGDLDTRNLRGKRTAQGGRVSLPVSAHGVGRLSRKWNVGAFYPRLRRFVLRKAGSSQEVRPEARRPAGSQREPVRFGQGEKGEIVVTM